VLARDVGVPDGALGVEADAIGETAGQLGLHPPGGQAAIRGDVEGGEPVNVFLFDGLIVPDLEGIITGGHDNKTARTVAIRQAEVINAFALTAMFKQIIANNRAGGWRKLKRES